MQADSGHQPLEKFDPPVERRPFGRVKLCEILGSVHLTKLVHPLPKIRSLLFRSHLEELVVVREHIGSQVHVLLHVYEFIDVALESLEEHFHLVHVKVAFGALGDEDCGHTALLDTAFHIGCG